MRGSFPTFGEECSLEFSQVKSEDKSPEIKAKGLERKHEDLIKSIGETSEELSQSKDIEGSLNESKREIERFSECYKSEEIDTRKEEANFESILTDPQTKTIWRNYFRHDKNVNVELFVNCLMSEYKDIFPSKPDILYKALNIIKERISLDGINVSLDALQIFTRLNGMNNTLKEIVTALLEESNDPIEDYNKDNPIEDEHQIEVNEEVNASSKDKQITSEQILNEIEEVKNMLDDKHKALIKKEQALREKELLLENQRNDFLQKITEFANSELKRSETILNRLVNAKIRRLESIEQLIENKLATLKRKIPENKSKQSFIQTEVNLDEKLKKQKTRIASLEQMHKELKAKYNDVLEKLEKEKTKSAEYAKQYEKYKSIVKIQDQKIQRQELTPQTPAETLISQKENELEAQKIRPKTIAMDSSKESLKICIALTSDIIKGTRNYLNSKGLCIGELLYSSMGNIVPEIVDCIHLLQGMQGQDIFLPLLEAVWETINFTFDNYLLKSSKKSLIKKIEYNKLGGLKTSLRTVTDSTKKEMKDDKEVLPIYPLFTNPAVTRMFLKDIESLFEPKRTTVSKSKDKLSIIPKSTANQVKAEVLIGLLTLSLTDTDKKVKNALEKLKASLNDKGSDIASKELFNYKGISILAIASTLEFVRQDCIEIFLALSIDPIAKNELFKQLNNKESVLCLVNAFEQSLDIGNTDQQDDLVVLMHKLIVTNEILLDVTTTETLKKILQKAIKSSKGNERRFFLSNVESLNTHLNSLTQTS